MALEVTTKVCIIYGHLDLQKSCIGEEFDYLVAADGIYSKTKQILFKDDGLPKYFNSIALRGNIHNFENFDISLYLGPNFHFVIYPINQNKEFNLANVSLFERQVESDRSRLQKGEISLTDLAQSESSLAGAQADFTKADTEYISATAEFEKITRVSAPRNLENNYQVSFFMPENLNNALKLSSNNNPSLAIARIELAISEKELSVEKAKLSPSATLNYSKTENKDLSDE